VFSPVLFFPLSLSPPGGDPSYLAKGFGGALLASPLAANDIYSHETRFLGSKYTKMRLRQIPGRKRMGMCLVAANVLVLLNEI